MILGVVLTLACLAGLGWGLTKKNQPMWITSSILLIVVLAVWYYFWANPY